MAQTADPVAALEAQSRFIAAASHELRTPIAHQRALVEVALADPDADASALREMGERVVAGCVEQERLVESLLAFAHSTHHLERREPVDLRELATSVLREAELDELAPTLDLQPAHTAGDPLLLKSLVANLVSNAIRHNVRGGQLELSTRTDSGRAVLAVANTGPIVPRTELGRLFRPFQQLDGARNAGVGLGLSIVEAIAAAHDATLAARPRRGGGLYIVVSFPPAAR